MALDDFAPASETPGQNPDGALPNAQPADEDLFNFPAPLAEPTATAEQPEAATGDDLMSDPPATEAPALPKTDIECTGLDPELDVDVFDFPPLDLSSLGVEPEPELPIEDSIEAATQSVHALLQDDLGDTLVQPPASTQLGNDLASSDSANASGAQSSYAQAPEAADLAQAQIQAQYQAQLAAQAAPMRVAVPAAASPKALWVLTGAVVVFLVGLLAIAWRATSSFQQQIEQVRADVSTSTAQLQRETADELQQIVALQGQMLRSTPQNTAEVERIPAMESPHETVLTVAREAIAKGRFADARRMLFTLLAEADRFPVESREDMERRASFLIAASHKREAETLQEIVE